MMIVVHFLKRGSVQFRHVMYEDHEMSLDAALSEATDVFNTRWPEQADSARDYEIFWINRAGVVVKDARSISFAMEPVDDVDDATLDDVNLVDLGAAACTAGRHQTPS